MKEFIQEWGAVIIVAVAVLAIIAIAVAMKPLMKKSFEGVVTDFSTQQESAINATEAPTTSH